MRPTTSRTSAATLALLLILGASACSDEPTSTGGPDGPARLSVFLTDQPGDLENVWVVVEEIHLQGGGGTVVLLDGPTDLVELTSLVGTVQLLVDEVGIEEGVYTQLRVILAGVVLEAEDGTVYTSGGLEHPDGLPAEGEVMCPSCAQSGLKVKLGGGSLQLDEGLTGVVLDFDVAQSFGHRAGKSGRWIMHPVIHATVFADEDGDGEVGDEVTGGASIEGTVSAASGVTIPDCPEGVGRSIEDFVPRAVALTVVDDEGTPVSRTGVVGSDGAFSIDFLPPDDYALGHLAELDLTDQVLRFDATVAPEEASVGPGEKVDGVAYTITEASCVQVEG
ncbi:MAG: DUF4382 domain-containing protein [Gemmatimonadota bacterium]|jgi:hypothetical protein